jgi:acetyl-CoA carboxylase carboxyltransferase component
MTWDPELTELAHRKALAAELGGPERVARQHATGRLTVRERIDALLDAGSWQETGSVAGTAAYDDGALSGFTPASAVTGTGRLDGRRVVVSADDFTIKGGAANPMLVGKAVDAERRALAERVPVVRLLDGTGGGGTVESLEEFGRTYVPYNPGWDSLVAQLAAVPVVTAALGPVAGLGAVRLVTSHVSVMVRELSQVFVAGPAVVEAGMGERLDKEQLGGWQVAARAGTVDLVADTEQEAFDLVRQVLSYLPSSVWERAPGRALRRPGGPARRRAALAGAALAPHALRRARPAAQRLRHRLGARARAAARAVHRHRAGPPRRPAGGGAGIRPARLRRRAHRRRLGQAGPPRRPRRRLRAARRAPGRPAGFVLGSASEAASVLRHGARALSAVEQSRVPWASVLVRRCFGVAGAGHRPLGRWSYRVAWPSGDWGSLPIEGGLEVAVQAAARDQPGRRRAEGRDRRAAGGGALAVPHRGVVPGRGGRRPRRHPAAAVRLGRAGPRAAAARGASAVDA